MTTLENMDNMVETSNGMGALGTTLNECVNYYTYFLRLTMKTH
jgi:hypothetical protein